MGLYIKDMEMPSSGTYEASIDVTNSNGKTAISVYLRDENDSRRFSVRVYEAVHVPPHGRLINADALIADLKRQCKEVFRIDAVSPDDFWITRDHAYNERLWKTWCESFFEYLKERDTVIPASEEGET